MARLAFSDVPCYGPFRALPVLWGPRNWHVWARSEDPASGSGLEVAECLASKASFRLERMPLSRLDLDLLCPKCAENIPDDWLVLATIGQRLVSSSQGNTRWLVEWFARATTSLFRLATLPASNSRPIRELRLQLLAELRRVELPYRAVLNTPELGPTGRADVLSLASRLTNTAIDAVQALPEGPLDSSWFALQVLPELMVKRSCEEHGIPLSLRVAMLKDSGDHAETISSWFVEAERSGDPRKHLAKTAKKLAAMAVPAARLSDICDAPPPPGGYRPFEMPVDAMRRSYQATLERTITDVLEDTWQKMSAILADDPPRSLLIPQLPTATEFVSTTPEGYALVEVLKRYAVCHIDLEDGKGIVGVTAPRTVIDWVLQTVDTRRFYTRKGTSIGPWMLRPLTPDSVDLKISPAAALLPSTVLVFGRGLTGDGLRAAVSLMLAGATVESALEVASELVAVETPATT